VKPDLLTIYSASFESLEIARLIDRQSSLARGWCYGEGVPVTTAIADIAKELSIEMHARGMSEFEVFPGVQGEIQVIGYIPDDSISLEFTVEPHGNAAKIILNYEIGNETVTEAEGLSPTQARQSIIRLLNSRRTKPCPGSAYFTFGTTAFARRDFQILPSSHPVTGPEYQSSTRNAHPETMDARVITSNTSIAQPMLQSA